MVAMYAVVRLSFACYKGSSMTNVGLKEKVTLPCVIRLAFFGLIDGLNSMNRSNFAFMYFLMERVWMIRIDYKRVKRKERF